MTRAVKIKITDLYKAFGSNKVLNGINLDIIQDRSLVILGASGTGKSVLIKTIIGLLQPDYGSIKIDAIETVGIKPAERLKHMAKYGFLFQNGALFDSLNIEDNITFLASRLYNLSHNDKKELAAEKLKSVGLKPDILTSYPSELSGGMQKRVSLARAICTNPEIIFFDEPTTGLDPIMSNVINELIVKIQQELGATLVTITHDINSARRIASDVALIHQGKILWHGLTNDMDRSDNKYLQQFIQGLTTGPII